MRCTRCIWALCLAMVVGGCQSQNATLTNPFLAADRVPPPATRTLVPGTAQPYYPGDPVPNSPAVMPPGPVPSYPPQNAPVVPPGGWNTAPPVSAASPTSSVRPVQAELPAGPIVDVGEQPVQVQNDAQHLRFTPVPLNQAPQPRQPSPVTAAAPAANWSEPTAIQVGAVGTSGSVFPEQQTGYPAPQRPVQLRAVPSGPGSRASSVDGFRPQGSSRTRSPNSSAMFSSPASSEDPGRFGYEMNYQWLRGQLAYAAPTGQWRLRYIATGQGLDALGGQVVIANPHVLVGLSPGEHVQLRGQLQTQGAGGPAVYSVSVVQRQQL